MWRGFVLPAVLALACSSQAAVVVLETNQGNLVLKLHRDKAPVTVDNFLRYVDDGFYNGVVFHRVIPDFMIQGGGFTPDLELKPPRAPIKNEADNGLSNQRGTVAMARTGVVDSATSQFFINLADNSRLDHKGKSAPQFGYCVFGEVSEGMDVVEKIRRAPTLCPSTPPGPCDQALPPGMRDVPAAPVIIRKAYRR